MKKLFMTEDSWSQLIARLALGVVMFPHGAQKVLGWFGGPGPGKTMEMFTTMMHLPAVIAVLVILAESAGALGLIFGFLARIAAFGVLCDMLGAIAMVHAKNGFFMNWMGKQPGEGFEYHLLAIGLSLAVLIGGAGRWSIDREIGKRLS